MATHAASTRPEPLLTKAHVIAAISGLVMALVMFGIVPQALGDQIKADADIVVGSIATVASIVAPYVHAVLGRKDVTPLSDPVAADGTPLVKVGSVEQVTADADAALAAANELYATESSTAS